MDKPGHVDNIKHISEKKEEEEEEKDEKDEWMMEARDHSSECFTYDVSPGP